MDDPRVRQAMVIDALFDAVMGVLLLMATWEWLYDALDLPHAEPEIFTQVAGGLLLAFAYLLWVGANDERVTRLVARAAAVANAAGALIIVIWLLVGDLGIDTLGTVLLALVAAILVVFAFLESSVFRSPGRS
jgi:hypothetical protein